MSRKRKNNTSRITKATPSESIHYSKIDNKIAELQLSKVAQLDKDIRSNDLEKAIAAQNFVTLQKQTGQKEASPKAFYWSPDDIGQGNRFKDTYKNVTFPVLQTMGETFFIKSIINTRIEQIQNFLKFTVDGQKEGYTIRRKTDGFDANMSAGSFVSAADKRQIKELRKYLEEGGFNAKWDDTDDLMDFVKKIMRDSLSMDQLAFECMRNRFGKLMKHRAMDGSTIRLLDSQDPRFAQEWEKLKKNGYFPRYAQVNNNMILNHPVTNSPILFYPWELGYGIRNKTTNVRANGYGISELESMVQIVTWLLNGTQYNGNIFKNGSQPKGFINIKGGGASNTTLSEFRQNWAQMMGAVENSHRIPVFEGIDLEWVSLQTNNKDMEFNSWIEFLILVACSVYRIDPSELGYSLRQQAQLFGQDGQKERLKHSKHKGLYPLLIFLEKIINFYLISEIDENFEFIFTGLDKEDKKLQAEITKIELDSGVLSFEHAFEQRMGRPYNPKKDTILNPNFISLQQMKTQGGELMNEIAENTDEGGDYKEPNQKNSPFAQFDKSHSGGENLYFDYLKNYAEKQLQ